MNEETAFRVHFLSQHFHPGFEWLLSLTLGLRFVGDLILSVLSTPTVVLWLDIFVFSMNPLYLPWWLGFAFPALAICYRFSVLFIDAMYF